MHHDCRYAIADGTGWVYCRSQWVQFGPGAQPLVSHKRCVDCAFKNRLCDSPRAEVNLNGKTLVELCQVAPATPRQPVDPTYPCVHRGQQVGEKRKEKCCGGKRPRIKVFYCPIRGGCTIAMDVGFTVCAQCKDRTPYAASAENQTG